MVHFFFRVRAFIFHVFFLPEETPVFDELFIDKNPYYRETMQEYWALDGTFVALEYTRDLKRELKAYKYYSKREKKDIFAPYLSECFRLLCLENVDRDAIVCTVPLHFWSRMKRGYNHSELLAQDLAKQEDLSFADLLKKSRYTKRQALLGKSDRLRNVRGSFSVREKHMNNVKGKDIILVDDVIST